MYVTRRCMLIVFVLVVVGTWSLLVVLLDVDPSERVVTSGQLRLEQKLARHEVQPADGTDAPEVDGGVESVPASKMPVPTQNQPTVQAEVERVNFSYPLRSTKKWAGLLQSELAQLPYAELRTRFLALRERPGVLRKSFGMVNAGSVRTYLVTRDSLYRNFLEPNNISDVFSYGRFDPECSFEALGAFHFLRDAIVGVVNPDDPSQDRTSLGFVLSGRFTPPPAQMSKVGSTNVTEVPAIPGFWSLFDMWGLRHAAMKLLMLYCLETLTFYDWIVFTRPDNYYHAPTDLSPLIEVAKTQSCVVNGTSMGPEMLRSLYIAPGCCNFGGFCDRIAVAAPETLTLVLEPPELWMPVAEDAANELNRRFRKQIRKKQMYRFRLPYEALHRVHLFMRNLTYVDDAVLEPSITLRTTLFRLYEVEYFCNFNQPTYYPTPMRYWPDTVCADRLKDYEAKPPRNSYDCRLSEEMIDDMPENKTITAFELEHIVRVPKRCHFPQYSQLCRGLRG